MRFLKPLIFLLSFGFLSATLAADKAPMVNVYKKPNTKTVLQTVSVDNDLISIINKKGWTKVADPNTGEVGWINDKQFQEAISAYLGSEPEVDSYMIVSEQTNDEKPTVDIIAYRDGKRLSEKDSKTLYKKIKKREKRRRRYYYRHHPRSYYYNPHRRYRNYYYSPYHRRYRYYNDDNFFWGIGPYYFKWDD